MCVCVCEGGLTAKDQTMLGVKWSTRSLLYVISTTIPLRFPALILLLVLFMLGVEVTNCCDRTAKDQTMFGAKWSTRSRLYVISTTIPLRFPALILLWVPFKLGVEVTSESTDLVLPAEPIESRLDIGILGEEFRMEIVDDDEALDKFPVSFIFFPEPFSGTDAVDFLLLPTVCLDESATTSSSSTGQ